MMDTSKWGEAGTAQSANMSFRLRQEQKVLLQSEANEHVPAAIKCLEANLNDTEANEQGEA